MRKITQFFQKLFSLTHTESKGFVKLLIVCISALILIFIPKFLIRNSAPVTHEEERILDSLSSILEHNLNSRGTGVLFIFDPNSLSVDSLVLLGFDKEIAERAKNYRDKGGVFYTKKDLKKIYGLTDQFFTRIHPYIDLPDSLTISRLQKSILPININEPNATQLKEISLIGEVLSARVISYRELLGGFVVLDQLSEVYGLSDAALANLKSATFIKSDFKPKLVKINYDSLDALSRHPYISYQLAEDILRFRKINSIIESETVLSNFKSIDKSNFKKLILYLDFQ